jgi:GNAT superfamily N-acetyltransferase
VDAHGQLSLTTVHRRFFTAHPTLSEDEVARFTNVDNVDRVALIALDGDSLVAVARYDRDPGTDEAEVAFVVVDAYQGRGLGTLLLEQLASAARHNGISTFTADVLLENAAMMRVFRGSGYPVTSSLSQGVFSIRFPIGREAADPSAQCGGPSTC